MMGSKRPRLAVALWLLILALSGWQLAHTRVVADLGAFLPPSATPAQQLLLDQMRSGVASRILLIAVSGSDDERLAEASRALAAKMRSNALFASVQHGGDEGLRADREAFMNYRYVLSPAAAHHRALLRAGGERRAGGRRGGQPRFRQRARHHARLRRHARR